MMCENGFKESAPLYQAMIIAISQTRRVSIVKVKQIVQLMDSNKVALHNGKGKALFCELTSVLKLSGSRRPRVLGGPSEVLHS